MQNIKRSLLFVGLALSGQVIPADDLAKCKNVLCERGNYAGQDLTPWNTYSLRDKYLNGSDFENSKMPHELCGRDLKGCNLYGAKFGGKSATISISDVSGSYINDETELKDLYIRDVRGFDKVHYPKCERTLQANQFDKVGLTNDQIIDNLVAGLHACDSSIAATKLYTKKALLQQVAPVVYDPTKLQADYASLADVIKRCQWNSQLARCGDVAHKFFKHEINESIVLPSVIHPSYSNKNTAKTKAYPIHLAIDANKPEAVQWLAVNGASLNEPDGDGLMPLHRATDNSIAAVSALVACSGVDVNKPLLTNIGFVAPLDRAVTNNQIKLVEALVKAPKIKLDSALTLAIKKDEATSVWSSSAGRLQKDMNAKIRQIIGRAQAGKYSLCRTTGWFCK